MDFMAIYICVNTSIIANLLVPYTECLKKVYHYIPQRVIFELDHKFGTGTVYIVIRGN